MPLSSRVSLSDQLTSCLVSFTQYTCLPWMLVHYQSRLYESWPKAIAFYGLLLTNMRFGAALGQAAASKLTELSLTYYTTLYCMLIGAYIGLAFVSESHLIVGLFCMLGFSGGVLRSLTVTSDGRSPFAVQHVPTTHS